MEPSHCIQIKPVTCRRSESWRLLRWIKYLGLTLDLLGHCIDKRCIMIVALAYLLFDMLLLLEILLRDLISHFIQGCGSKSVVILSLFELFKVFTGSVEPTFRYTLEAFNCCCPKLICLR